MLSTPFLTALDSRAAIKGSRDPLGVQAIWTRLGRHVVGNLTTVTTSLADFVVVMLGHWLAEEVGGDAERLPTFLKWEQVCGYARAVAADGGSFRGTERVRAHLAAGARVRVAADAEAQILGDQKTYGLWGLYTAASRASGLLEGEPVRLSPDARQLVESEYVPRLTRALPRGVKGLVERLRAPEWMLEPRGRDGSWLGVVAEVLTGARTAAERAFLDDRLVRGALADAHACQAPLADLLAETVHETDWRLTPEAIGALASRAARRSPDTSLAERIERIRTCELLLAPGVALFEFVLGCEGQRPADVATRLQEHWGRAPRATIDLARTTSLKPELGGWLGDTESGARWLRLAQALVDADYVSAVETVLAQNAAVMRARGGAVAWAEVRSGRLEVRYRDERRTLLPEASELATYWRHAYFVEALREITSAVRGPQ